MGNCWFILIRYVWAVFLFSFDFDVHTITIVEKYTRILWYARALSGGNRFPRGWYFDFCSLEKSLILFTLKKKPPKHRKKTKRYVQFVQNVLFLFRHNPQIIFLQTTCFCGRPRWSDVLEIKTEMFEDEEKYIVSDVRGGWRGFDVSL